jgi:parvulin-like peptidyl-prolyl isomerase
LIHEKAEEHALAEARRLLGELKKGEAFSLAKETVPFGRSDFVPESGVVGEFFEEAYDLSPGEFGGPLSAGETLWLYQLLERAEAPREEFNPEKKKIVSRLRDAKEKLLFQSWLDDLRKVRSVWYNEVLVGEI